MLQYACARKAYALNCTDICNCTDCGNEAVEEEIYSDNENDSDSKFSY